MLHGMNWNSSNKVLNVNGVVGMQNDFDEKQFQCSYIHYQVNLLFPSLELYSSLNFSKYIGKTLFDLIIEMSSQNQIWTNSLKTKSNYGLILLGMLDASIPSFSKEHLHDTSTMAGKRQKLFVKVCDQKGGFIFHLIFVVYFGICTWYLIHVSCAQLF